jgi:hypothetical protein
MEIPNHLKHKPIIRLEEYSLIDGIYDAAKTDARGMSIGLAQWNNTTQKDLSAKVWRYTSGKWSRQSEELPLHRVFDLASLVCASISYAQNSTLPPIDDSFHVDLVKNPELLNQLKEGLEDENTKKALEVSLKRLSKYLKTIGY